METSKPWLTELSYLFILPTVLYIAFASSAVWASGNIFWTSFYAFFSDSTKIQLFNVWSLVIFVGGTLSAFILALSSLLIKLKNNERPAISDYLALAFSGLLFISFVLFYSGLNIYSLLLN